MFNFQHIEYLLGLILLLPIIWFYFYALNKKKKTAAKIGNPELVKRLTKTYSSKRFLYKFLFLFTAIFFLVIALANPRTIGGKKQITRTGIDVIFALDVSNSMLAADINPNRLEKAKQVMLSLTNKLEDSRIGIIIFAGKAYLQMPLTGDHSAASMFIASVNTNSVPSQGTDIVSALKMSNLAFTSDEKNYKAVVLLSDGEEQDPGAVKEAELMAASGIVINTVGFGSEQGAPIPDLSTGQFKLDENGKVVISKYNRNTMAQIAKAGNGFFQDYVSTDAVVKSLFTELKNMDEREVKDESLIDYKSYFQIFLLIALFFIILELIVSENKRIRKKIIKPAIASLILFSTLNTFAQSNNEIIQSGNKFYKSGEFEKASEEFLKASENNADFIPEYNRAISLFRLKKSDEAIASLNKAREKAKLNADLSDIYYNQGVIYQMNENLPECISAYKNSLKLNPANEDARQNLQKALRKQKEKDQEKQKKEKKNKPENKKPTSKLTKEDAENKLKALQQQEKNIREKMKKSDGDQGPSPVKDW